MATAGASTALATATPPGYPLSPAGGVSQMEDFGMMRSSNVNPGGGGLTGIAMRPPWCPPVAEQREKGPWSGARSAIIRGPARYSSQ